MVWSFKHSDADGKSEDGDDESDQNSSGWILNYATLVAESAVRTEVHLLSQCLGIEVREGCYVEHVPHNDKHSEKHASIEYL